MSGMASKSRLLPALRAFHLYFGVLIAPALIFFAFTGALQTFGLHENSRDGAYKAPHWAMVLGQIHKKQSAILPVRKTPVTDALQKPPSSMALPLPPTERHAAPLAVATSRHPLPLRIFFLLVCIGLVSSSLSGIYMAYKYRRGKAVITMLLLAGMLVPVALIFV